MQLWSYEQLYPIQGMTSHLRSSYRCSMNRLLLLIVLAFFATLTARAQVVEAYGTLAIDPLSNVELLPYTSQQFSSYTPAGFTFGGTLNFINFSRIAAGLDVSETVASGARIWLAGFRIMVKPPVLRIKPSFKLAVGRANLHVPNHYGGFIPNPAPVDAYIYNAALAVDYRLARFVDARIEVGDGRTLGAGSTNPTNLLTVNAGIVAHF